MMPGFGGGMGAFGGLTMALGWLGSIAIGAALVWLLVRAAKSTDDKGGAREILAQRYARGEIDEEEYQRRLRTLGS